MTKKNKLDVDFQSEMQMSFQHQERRDKAEGVNKNKKLLMTKEQV